MALVPFTDGEETDKTLTSEKTESVWVGPASMDSADTVTLPTITDKTPGILSSFDRTTGDAVTATISGQVVTIDAAGATTNHVYVLAYQYE